MLKMDAMYMTFRKYYKMVFKEMNTKLEPYNISSKHGNYLIALISNDGMTIKELNEAVENDGAITTRVLKKLSDESLIAVVTKSARVSIVTLTKTGKKLGRSLLATLGATRRKIFSKLNPIEIMQLQKIYKKLA